MVRTKVKKEASLFSVVFTTVCTGFLGVILGFAHEVSRSAVFGSGSAAEAHAEETHSPLFLSPESTSGSGWQTILEQVDDGRANSGTLVLTEGDLNRIADEYLNFSETKERMLADPDQLPSYAILPETPILSMDTDHLQLSVPFQVLLFGSERDGVLVLDGTFADNPSAPKLKIRESWINSARVPPFLARFLVGRMVASYRKLSPESPLITGWNNLKGIDISNRELILEVR